MMVSSGVRNTRKVAAGSGVSRPPGMSEVYLSPRQHADEGCSALQTLHELREQDVGRKLLTPSLPLEIHNCKVSL